jgi:hypothetical protein
MCHSLGMLVLLSVLMLQARYDLVIQGGQVIDPETGLDAVKNIGISGESLCESPVRHSMAAES